MLRPVGDELGNAIDHALGVLDRVVDGASHPDRRPELSQFVGALYALQRARANGYRDEVAERTADAEHAWGELRHHIAECRDGHGYTDSVWSEWAAGFYFNGAVSRLARIEEIIGISRGNPPPAVQSLRDRDNWLKHKNRAQKASITEAEVATVVRLIADHLV